MAKKVAGINIPIDVESRQFNAEMKDVNKSLTQSARLGNELNKSLKLDPTSVDVMNKKVNNLEEQIGLADKKTEMLNDELNRLKSIDAPDEEIAKLELQLLKATNQSTALNNELNRTNQEIANINAAPINSISQGMDASTEATKKTGRAFVTFDGIIAGTIALSFLLWKGFKIGARISLGLIKTTIGLAGVMDDLDEKFSAINGQLNLTIPQMIGFMGATVLTGISATGLTKALIKMQKNLVGQPELWQALNVEIYNADGSLRSLNEILPETINSIAAIEDPATRSAYALAIFGKSATEVARLNDIGITSFQELSAEITALVDPADIEALVELQTHIDKINVKAKELAIDGLGNLAAEMNEWLTSVEESIASGDIQIKSFNDLVGALAPLVKKTEEARKRQDEYNEALEEGEVDYHDISKEARKATDSLHGYIMKMVTNLPAMKDFNDELQRQNELLATNAASPAPTTETGKSSRSINTNSMAYIPQNTSATTNASTPPTSENNTTNKSKTINISNLTIKSEITNLDDFVPDLFKKIDEYAGRIS